MPASRALAVLLAAVVVQSLSGARRLSEEEPEEAHSTPWMSFVEQWLGACTDGECKARTPVATALEAMELLHGATPSNFHRGIEAKMDVLGMPNTTFQLPSLDHGCGFGTEGTVVCYPVPKWPPRLFDETVPSPSLVIELNPFLGQSTVRRVHASIDATHGTQAPSAPGR